MNKQDINRVGLTLVKDSKDVLWLTEVVKITVKWKRVGH